MRAKNKEIVRALVGEGNYVEDVELVQNPTSDDINEFYKLVDEEIQNRIEQQLSDFGYVLYTDSQIENLRAELRGQGIYRRTYKVNHDTLPSEEEVDKIVEETLFGTVSDKEFVRRLNKFLEGSPFTKVGVAKMMGVSETHFGEVLRGNRNLSKKFRVSVTKVLSKFGFK